MANVSIPNRDLGKFQPLAGQAAGQQAYVSIPNRDLGKFQQISDQRRWFRASFNP